MKAKHEKMLLIGGIVGGFAIATIVGIATNPIKAAPRTRPACDEGYVLVGGVYQRPDWVCVKGHEPRQVPVTP